jgi:hypothetical protein
MHPINYLMKQTYGNNKSIIGYTTSRINELHCNHKLFKSCKKLTPENHIIDLYFYCLEITKPIKKLFN